MTMRWRALSIRARLTGWYALVLTGMLIVYATTTFVAVRHEFMEQLDERLHEDFEAAEAQLTRAPDGRVESTANRDRDEHGGEVHVYEVWSAAGEQLHRSESTFTLPPFPISSIDSTYRYDTVTVGGRRWRTLASLVLANNQTVVLRAARSEEPLRGELREILVVLALGRHWSWYLREVAVTCSRGGPLLRLIISRPKRDGSPLTDCTNA